MDKRTQLIKLLDQCSELPAEVRYQPDSMSMTVIIPPPWDAAAENKAICTQKTIQEWSKQYPDVICYCFDSFSTLLYAL